MYGAGTQLVENEIKKNINEYSVVRMDSETLDLLDFEKITGRKIIIGTQAAWTKIDWEKIEIVAFIDVDSQLLMPEFRIEEELFYNIRDARFKAKETAKIILQTNHKDYPFFEKIRDNSVFYEQELSARKDLFYPPFSYIIRVLFPADSAQISESEANFYLNKAKTLTLNDKRVIISGPIPMNPAYHDRKYWSTIIIKIPTEKKYEYVKQLAEWAPDESKFDPNPNSLLSF
jgi:primosomal protein N' (replication factor Y)